MAAERARAAALAEPDRLEGFSAPREVDRLFGHAAARGEFERAPLRRAKALAPAQLPRNAPGECAGAIVP